MPRRIALALALLPLTLCAQTINRVERIDSSVIRAYRMRPDQALVPIQAADLRRTASPLGEADPVKYIQTLPGVSSGMEGTSAYYVRGGNDGNNLTTLDGVPLYGSGHLLGMTTAYPADIISKSEFFAGGFPAEAGGYSSSLLQLTSCDGDFQRPQGMVSVNNFLTGVLLSTPLRKDRLSLLASARISPIGPEYNLLRPKMPEGLSLPDRISALVGDAFTKLTWRPNGQNRVSLSVFGSYDRYGYDRSSNDSNELGWNNFITNLTWVRQTLSGWKWEGVLSHNHFAAFQDQLERPRQALQHSTRMSLQSALMEEGLQVKFSRPQRKPLDFLGGADCFVSFFQPGITKVYEDKVLSATAGHSLMTVRSSLHGQVNYDRDHIHAGAGLRITSFFSESYSTVYPTANILVSFDIRPGLSVKATYDHTVQFFHSLEGIPTGWSLEMLIPSSRQNRPETADQIWLGSEFSRRIFFFSVGGFYKRMQNLVFFADASSFFNSAWREWQSNLESGNGRAYGLESFARMETDRFSGQLSYTLSKTDRNFPSQNFGLPFPFKFDRRHMLNLSGEFRIASVARSSHSITAGLSWMNGHWETVKSGSYPVYSVGGREKRETSEASYTSHPNNLQLPAYFRLDLGYHLALKGRKCLRELSLGVYNLTNRHNAFNLSWDSQAGCWKKMSIFPILPNFSYRITFGQN